MKKFNEVATLIKRKRELKDWSQRETWEQINEKGSTQNLSNIERGLCTIPMKRLTFLCDVLEITKEEIKTAYLLDVSNTLDFYLTKEAAKVINEEVS